MTKQDYTIDRPNNKEIIVNQNPRMFKALKNEIISLTDELKRLFDVSEDSEKLVEIIKVVVEMVEKLNK